MDSRAGDDETAAVTARENLKQRLSAFLSLARELFASTAHAAGAEQPARQRQLRPPTEVMAALIANDTALVTACGELEQMTQFELKVRRFKAQIKAEEKQLWLAKQLHKNACATAGAPYPEPAAAAAPRAGARAPLPRRSPPRPPWSTRRF